MKNVEDEVLRAFRFTPEQMEILKSNHVLDNWASLFAFDVFPFVWCNRDDTLSVRIMDAPRKVGRIAEPRFDPLSIVDKVDAAKDLLTVTFKSNYYLFYVDIDMASGKIVYIGIHGNMTILTNDTIFTEMPVWKLTSKIILEQKPGGFLTNMVTGNPVHFFELNSDSKFAQTTFRCKEGTLCSMAFHVQSVVYDNIPLFLMYTGMDGMVKMRVAYYDVELGSIFLGKLLYSTDLWQPCAIRRTDCEFLGYNEVVYDILYCQGENNYDTAFTRSNNYIRSQWQRIDVGPLFLAVKQDIATFCDTTIVQRLQALRRQFVNVDKC